THILGYGRLADSDAQLEQLAMNPWSTPERVGKADVADQCPNVEGQLRTTTGRFRLPSPEQTKPRAVPTDYGFRPHDRQGAPHVRRQAVQPGKYQPIDVAEGRPLGGFPPQDIELMAKHQDLCFQRGSRSEKSDQPAPDQPAE